MEKEDNYPASFTGLDYSLDHHPLQQTSDTSGKDNNNNNNNGTDVDHYMLNNHNHHHHHHQHQQHQQQMLSSGFCSTSSAASLDRLSFADVMQFADFGPKLVLNQTNNKISEDHHHETTTGIIDPVYFLKFPVLNNNDNLDNQDHQSLMTIPPHHLPVADDYDDEEDEETFRKYSEEGDGENMDEAARGASVQQLQFLGENIPKNRPGGTESKKRKRPRSIKTSEEVESQRMTHIAVERNRRKQMNEHLRVLRSLMPGSYVQRGDQASIIGGAIEFVRELEQLLQCLESQKRRRLCGDNQRPTTGGDSNNSVVGIIQQPQPPFIFPDPMPLSNDQMKLNIDFDTGLLREETAENKSCLADVEVKLLGFDGIIKILSRRRPGQLIKTIAALEDLQLNILHTNITTIEQTVLYSFNVKVASESQFSAEDIASSVQQIFTFIHANSI